MAAAEILHKTWWLVAGGWWCAGDAMQRMLSQLLQMMYGMSVQTAAGETLRLLQHCRYPLSAVIATLQLPALATSPRLWCQLANCPASNILCVSVCEIQSNAFCVRCF